MEKSGFTGIIIKDECIYKREKRVTIVEKILKYGFYFLMRLFVLLILLAVLWLWIGKVKESIQVIQSHPLDRGSISPTKYLGLLETNHENNDTRDKKIHTQTKPETKTDKGSEESRMVPPVLIKRIAPEYPEDALRLGLQGKVVFEAEIDAKGQIRSAQLVRSCHPIFVSTTLKAIRQWLYRPMLLNEKPCSCFTTITCVFRLIKARKKFKVMVWTGII